MKYDTLKALVNAKVYENTEQEITGWDMNNVLQSAIASLGAHYQMGGLVSPNDKITVGDEPVVFLATTPGTYTYFGGLVVADGEVALLVWSGTAWSKQTPDIATGTEVSQLGQKSLYHKDIPWKVWGSNTYVNYGDGLAQASSFSSVIDYVNVSDYAGKAIFYSRLCSPNTFGNQGMAFYDENKTYISGVQCVLNASEISIVLDNVVVPQNAKFARFSCPTSLVSEFQLYYLSENNTSVFNDIYEQLSKKVDAPDTSEKEWTNNSEANKHISELYIEPQYYVSGMKIRTCVVRGNAFSLYIADANNNTIFLRSMDWQEKISYPILPYSDLMIPIFRYTDAQQMGFVKMKYTGVDYGVSSVSYVLNEDVVTNIDNSPTIKEIYNNDHEALLFGDSLISYPASAKLLFVSYITNRLKMKVWDAGCAGCTMAYRTQDGSDYYDQFTFVKLVDSFLTGEYNDTQLSTTDYGNSIKSLQSVDKTKKLLIINEYCINDFQNPISKGNLFVADASTYNINDLDKTTMLGAMSYGVARLFETKPDIKYCQVTTPYVVFGDGFGYADKQIVNKGTFKEWCESVKENAIHLGVPCVMGIDMQDDRNFFTNRASGVNTVDGNHANEFGMFFIAQCFGRIYENML